MAEKILVVAPHPDDETLGVGATLLKHKAAGDQLYWLIMTDMTGDPHYAEVLQQQRKQEIASVAKQYGFQETIQLPFPPARLDHPPMADVVGRVADVISTIRPSTVYVVHRGDAHSDHRITFDAVMAATKPFRATSVRRVLSYETPSETEMGPALAASAFVPTCFVDVSATFAEKLRILESYHSEIGAHPFPRSLQTLTALAQWRGSTANVPLAEAFMLLREIR